MIRSLMKTCRSGNIFAQKINPQYMGTCSTTTATQLEETFFHTDSAYPITSRLELIDSNKSPKISVFRLMDPKGIPLVDSNLPNVNEDWCVKMYKTMVRIQALDDIFYNAQRQGRISFYMQSAGEEAIHIGSAAALEKEDIVLAQYREVGILLWRGFPLQQCADQCFSNMSDLGKGRQMPVHYGSKELNYQTISSPLATQLPQAVGVAYSLKLSGDNALPICYFGEGAASEGDFHAALNFASTLDVPMIFFCRNNGYAISTPSSEQYRGDGIASRAAGYGMHCIRVDGNDIFAVYMATKAARTLALEKSCPVLIEAMTYRRGHHSTSDDSTRYRSISEIQHWQDNFDPVKRVRMFLETKNWWDEDKEQTLRDSERLAVLQALELAEKKSKPGLNTMFEDVYKTKLPHLLAQEKELLEHMEKYPEYYSNSGH